MKQKILSGLASTEYEHPHDRKALDSLEKTPGLPSLVKAVNKYSLDKLLKIQSTGSYLQLGDNQLPRVYNLFVEACKILDVKPIPRLYLFQDYQINAYAAGVSDPYVAITTGDLERLDEEELRFLLGHELGHIKSEHLLYHQIGQFIPLLGQIAGSVTLGIGSLVATGLEFALYYWYRMSEFTSDRAGLLTCQNPEVAHRVLTKLAAGGQKFPFGEINYEDFKQQADEFKEFDFDALDKIAKLWAIRYSRHPWTVLRSSELSKWVKSGDYDRILKRVATLIK